jgi:hypothetical protein
MELTTYVCHKKVQAFKIHEVRWHLPGATLYDSGGFGWAVTGNWVERHKPKLPADLTDGYFVRYEDGYESWSPAEAFEKGYAVITPATLEERSLLILLEAIGTHTGPEKIMHFDLVNECLIGIGDDHTARILIDAEVLDVLRKRVHG